MSMLSVLLSLVCVASLSVPPGDDNVLVSEPASAFETYSIHRPNGWWWYRTSRIGEYAVVRHRPLASSSRNYKTHTKFSLEVTTSQGPDVKLRGKIHTVYTDVSWDDKGFVEGIVAYALLDDPGRSGPKIDYSVFTSHYSATIVTGDSTGDTWQFSAELDHVNGDLFPRKVGTLSNGARVLQIAGRTSVDSFDEIYEDGELLARNIAGREYVLSVGLSPKLKVLLITAMEIFELDHRGEYSR